MTIQTALLQGTELLENAAVPVARLTAEVLLAHALHCDRTFLYAHGEDPLPERAWIHYGRYLNERLKGKPTQYITRRQEFYGRDFYVNEHVLIPRPETEHLVEAAIAYLNDHPNSVVLDVGTGSGAIAISVALESAKGADARRQTAEEPARPSGGAPDTGPVLRVFPGSHRAVLASDISAPALAVAERNRRTHAAQVSFFCADLLEAVQPHSIDLLLSNPPYVPGSDAANMQIEVRDFEPHVALFADDSGLEIYRRLIAGAESVLKPGGRLMMELGYRSLDGVRALLAPHWTGIDVISDLAGWPRVIQATASSG